MAKNTKTKPDKPEAKSVKLTRKTRQMRPDYLTPAVCREAGSHAPAKARRIDARRKLLRKGLTIRDASRVLYADDDHPLKVRNRKSFVRVDTYGVPRIDAKKAN